MEKKTLEMEERWTVWVGGVEVLDYLVDKSTADRLALRWKRKGYADTVVNYYTDAELNGVRLS